MECEDVLEIVFMMCVCIDSLLFVCEFLLVLFFWVEFRIVEFNLLSLRILEFKLLELVCINMLLVFCEDVVFCLICWIVVERLCFMFVVDLVEILFI